MRKYRNSSGFTLVEVMIVAGLIGGLSVALMNMVQQVMKVSKRSSQVFTVEQEVRSISDSLRDKAICEATILDPRTGITANSNGTPQNPILSSLTPTHDDLTYAEIKRPDGTILYQVYDIDGNPDATSGLLDNELGSRDAQVIALEGILLQNFTPVEDFQDSSNVTKRIGKAGVRLIFKKGRTLTSDTQIQNTSYGSATLSRVITIQVIADVATGTIEGCYSSDDQYIEGACTALGGRLDGLGQCVEIKGRNDETASEQVFPALMVGSNANSIDLGGASYIPPMVVTRENLVYPGSISGQKLEVDDNEIQSISSTGQTLHLNRRGGDVSIGQDTSSNLVVNGNISGVDGAFSGGLGVSGNTTLGGTLGVAGNTALGGTLGVTGNTTIGGTTEITGQTTLRNNLIVEGNTTLGNSTTGDRVIVNSALDVNGVSTFTGNASFTGSLTRPSFATTGNFSGSVDEVPTIAWVKDRIAKSIDPDGQVATDIASSILTGANATEALQRAINKDDCQNQTWTSSPAGFITKSWSSGNRCEYVVDFTKMPNTDTKCNASGVCSQVCIGTTCRTSWLQHLVINSPSSFTIGNTGQSSAYKCYALYPHYDSWPALSRSFINVGGKVNSTLAPGTFSTSNSRICGRNAFIKGFTQLTLANLPATWWPVCCKLWFDNDEYYY